MLYYLHDVIIPNYIIKIKENIMKEKLYAIPVNDAFSKDCECPVCAMYKELENNAVEYTMGPSYMEDDIRAVTDRLGFCDKHVKMVYDQNNRLGMALVMSTHLRKTIGEVKAATKHRTMPKISLFSKNKTTGNPVTEYIHNLDNSCFVCSRINGIFDRYIATIFHLWKTDEAFREKYKSSKGFCQRHYAVLTDYAPNEIKDSALDEFLSITDKLYIENMERVLGDIDWFINKFDFRYDNEPWKNSKDSLQRAILKTNSVDIE